MLKLGLRGILRLTLFKDVTMLSGCGVGGGSLVYANTLYRPPERFYRDGQWEGMTDWEEALEPHYDTAERMLGAAKIPGDDRATRCSGRLLFTLMVGPGSRLGRPLNLGRTLIRSPRHVLAALAPGVLGPADADPARHADARQRHGLPRPPPAVPARLAHDPP